MSRSVIALCLVAVLVCVWSESYAKPCSYSCGLQCRYDPYVRRVRCGVQCGLRCSFGKRSVDDKDGTVYQQLPPDFEDYDRNGNGKVTLAEFATTLMAKDELCKKAFGMADKNDDGQLTKEEFDAAPFDKIRKE